VVGPIESSFLSASVRPPLHDRRSPSRVDLKIADMRSSISFTLASPLWIPDFLVSRYLTFGAPLPSSLPSRILVLFL